MLVQRQTQPTTAIDLSDPDLGITLILPSSIAQCDHFLVFYSLSAGSSKDAVVNFTSVGDTTAFFELKPPEGEGYLDWVCDVPTGQSFTASTKGGEYSYTVGDGTPDCLGVVATTSFAFASYSVPRFTSYTAQQVTSTPEVVATQTALTTEFPTDTGFSTISVPTGLFVGPTPNNITNRHSSIHGIVIAYVLGAVIVLLLPICCYKRVFRSLYSHIFRSHLSKSTPLPLSIAPSPKFAEFPSSSMPTSRATVPDPPPASTAPRSQVLPQRVPSSLVPVPPPNPRPNGPHAVTAAPQRPSPLRTHSLPLSTEISSLENRRPDPVECSTSEPQPLRTHQRSPSSLLAISQTPPAPGGSPPIVAKPRSSDTFGKGISTGSRDGPRTRRLSRTRYASPDELAAIDILASMDRLQRIAFVESVPLHESQPKETMRPWSEIRLPDPSQRQTVALKILNDRGPDERRVLIDAVLRRGKEVKRDGGDPSGSPSSAPRDRGLEGELAAVNMLSMLSASRRSGFFAAALRDEGGVDGCSSSGSFRPIDRRGLSADKVGIVEVLENMSGAQRRAVVAAVLREGNSV